MKKNKFNNLNLNMNDYFKIHPSYIKSQNSYNENNKIINIEKNIYDFGYKIISIEELDKMFNIDINNYNYIINNLGNLFTDLNLEMGAGDISNPIMKRIKIDSIFKNSDIINNLYNLILPIIEKNIYNSYIQIIDINMYKNTFNNLKEGKSSWLWHFDNHPNEFIKIMIYLTDVDENSAPFEIIVDNNNNPIKLNSSKYSLEDWNKNNDIQYFKNQYNGNRIPNETIDDLCNKGYKKKKICGKKGTIILFSENIIHRATYPINKERCVINTIIAPSLHKTNYNINKNNLINKDRYKIWSFN